jgi:hypothetical protein
MNLISIWKPKSIRTEKKRKRRNKMVTQTISLINRFETVKLFFRGFFKCWKFAPNYNLIFRIEKDSEINSE